MNILKRPNQYDIILVFVGDKSQKYPSTLKSKTLSSKELFGSHIVGIATNYWYLCQLVITKLHSSEVWRYFLMDYWMIEGADIFLMITTSGQKLELLR